jgi:hypothetical protein
VGRVHKKAALYTLSTVSRGYPDVIIVKGMMKILPEKAASK